MHLLVVYGGVAVGGRVRLFRPVAVGGSSVDGSRGRGRPQQARGGRAQRGVVGEVVDVVCSEGGVVEREREGIVNAATRQRGR